MDKVPIIKHLPLSFEGINVKGESKRGEASLKQPIPLPLVKGKGIKGIGLLKLRGVRFDA